MDTRNNSQQKKSIKKVYAIDYDLTIVDEYNAYKDEAFWRDFIPKIDSNDTVIMTVTYNDDIEKVWNGIIGLLGGTMTKTEEHDTGEYIILENCPVKIIWRINQTNVNIDNKNNGTHEAMAVLGYNHKEIADKSNIIVIDDQSIHCEKAQKAGYTAVLVEEGYQKRLRDIAQGKKVELLKFAVIEQKGDGTDYDDVPEIKRSTQSESTNIPLGKQPHNPTNQYDSADSNSEVFSPDMNKIDVITPVTVLQNSIFAPGKSKISSTTINHYPVAISPRHSTGETEISELDAQVSEVGNERKCCNCSML